MEELFGKTIYKITKFYKLNENEDVNCHLLLQIIRHVPYYLNVPSKDVNYSKRLTGYCVIWLVLVFPSRLYRRDHVKQCSRQRIESPRLRKRHVVFNVPRAGPCKSLETIVSAFNVCSSWNSKILDLTFHYYYATFARLSLFNVTLNVNLEHILQLV